MRAIPLISASVAALLLAPVLTSRCPAQDQAAIALPAPRTAGGFSVEAALATRRSLRGMADQPLALADLGQLCWAAQGVTDDKGHRTAPSAMATYPLDVYIVAGMVSDLAAGIYHYQPANHVLVPIAAGDQRAGLVERAIGQSWITTAPATLVITGTAERMGERLRARNRDFMCVEAGLAAQGFFLQATALGLGSTYVGGFDPAQAKAFLALPDGEEVLAILPVGAPR